MAKSLYVSELLPPEQLAPIIRASGCGLELITFSVSDNLDHYPDTLFKARELLHRLGNPPCTIHGPFLDLNPMSYDSLIRQVTMDRFARAYEAAAALGADKIIYHSGMIPSVYYLEGWAERMSDFWNEFLDSRSGIPVCMENVLDREIAPFEEVVSAVKHPDFGICLDLGHAHCYSRYSAQEWLDRLGPAIRHLHVHDNDGTKDAHRGTGYGTIPYASLMKHPVFLSDAVSATVECAEEAEAMESLALLKHSE